MEGSIGSTDKFNTKKCINWTVKLIKKRIPIIDWLPKYRWKEDFISDLFAGLTIMFVNVPQGLAFSVLANVDLMYGLYTSCFSAFLYTIFGTATISSFGPVAIGSMLTGEAVSRVTNMEFTPNDIAVVITFLIGVWYLIGFLLRLGVISRIFRKPYVSGFITACALHILGKSVKMILGLKVQNSSGYFSFFYNLYKIYDKFSLINYPTVIVSTVIFVTLALNGFVFRPFLAKHTKFTIPIEAFVMLVTTLLSYKLKFEDMGIPVVGYVPTGFPKFSPPDLNIVGEVWAASLVVAIINYSTSVSMTLIFNKNLDSNQELLAMSIANLACSNLQCLTMGNSMMRTLIAVNTGLKTQISTILASILLLFVILYAGPLFQPLPTCVLGCIILASAGQLLLQRLMEVKAIWLSSLENGFIWATSLAAGLLLDVQAGMVAGALLSLRQILAELHHKDVLDKKEQLVNEPKQNNELIDPVEQVSLLKQSDKLEVKIV